MSEISNPYIAGAPVVESSMFFGREDVFKWIERSLAGKYVNHILVIHGQRRVGKTSVLKQIPNFLPKHYIQVFFDLQGRTSTSLDRFLWWLASEIVRTLKKERDIDVPRPERKAFEDPEYLIGVFLPSLRPLLGEQILILTFDEFDTLDKPDIQETLARPLIAYLRRMMEMDGLNFIFSIGSSGDKLENMQASYTDFFKSALYRKISFLTRDDCHRLITKPVEGTIQYERKAVDRIVEITSGHPYFTQLMCHELFALCQKTGSRAISAENVESILGDVIERGTVNLKFVWDEASDLEKWTLAGLAQLERGASTQKLSQLLHDQRVRFSDADLNGALIHLRDKDILTQDNRFVIHLMRMWLLANRPLDRVREELAEANPIANRYIEIGDEYRDRGQVEQAVESYQQALKADPGNLRAQASIGQIYFDAKNYEQAAAAFELSLQIDDEDVGARTGFCNALLAQAESERDFGQVETALRLYEKILVANPAHRDARRRLANIHQQRAESYLQAGQDDLALSALNKALDYTPEDGSLAARYDEVLAQKKNRVLADWQEKAETARARQYWEEAAGFLEEALKLDPHNQDLQAKLLDVKDAPRQAKIKGYRQEAEQAIKRRNFEKAVNALETALLLSPGDPDLTNWLETVRNDQRNAQFLLVEEQIKRATAAGDWDGAIENIHQARKIAPTEDDWDRKIAEIESARRQAQFSAYREQAIAARQAGRWDDAIAALQKYCELQPDDQAEIEREVSEIQQQKRQGEMLALKSQAEKSAKAEKWPEAVQAWENYLKFEPEDAGEVEKSLDRARKYARIAADYLNAQEAMRKKRYGRAIELLQGIIAQAPTYKATSRLLVEAVEANKTIPPWRQARVWGGLTAVIMLIVVIGFGIVWLGQQDFTFPTASSAPTKTSTPPQMITPSLTPTPIVNPAVQAALTIIQREEPLYQTSFDDWDTNESGHNAALVNGKLVLTSEEGEDGAVLGLNVYPADRYVVEFEFSISEDASADGLCVYEARSDAQFNEESWRAFSAEFYPGEDLAVLSIFDPQSRVQPRIATVSFDKTKSNVIRLVVLGDQITAFINGQFAYTAQDPNGSAVYFGNNLAAYNRVTCEFDHFKYWDLRDMDSAVKIALETIRNEEPLYQTSFDTWEFGELPGNAALENGKLVVRGGENQSTYVSHTNIQSDRFAIQFETQIIGANTQEGGCLLNIGTDDEYNMRNIFMPSGELEVDHLEVDGYEITIGNGQFDPSNVSTIMLVVLNDQISLFVDGGLAFTAHDPEGGSVYTNVAYEADSHMTCGFDNFKFWDLRDLDPAVKIALATIHNQEPLYQTSFDSWEFGTQPKNATMEDGKLILASENIETPSTDVRINSHNSDTFAIQYDLRIRQGTNGPDNCYSSSANDAKGWSESWRTLFFQFQKSSALLGRFNGTDITDFMIADNLSFSAAKTVTIFVIKDQITTFVNDQLIYTVRDPGGSAVYAHHVLSAYGENVCEYDNYKYWDLSGVNFSSGTATTSGISFFGATLDSIAGKTPDYEDDFSNLESGWPTDRNSTGNEYGYQDGAYLISAKNICNGPSLPADRVFSDFVLEMDVKFVNQGEGSASILFWDQLASYGANIQPNGWANFHKNVNGIHFDMLGTAVSESHFQAWDTTKHLTLIARQDHIALYVNEKLIIALADTETTSSQGGINFAVCTNTPLQVLIDNLKIWHITDLSP
jgi:tetratricopeptide (TPR) repeat protein